MWGVWEELLGEIQPDPAPEDPHQGEALRVSRVWEELLQELSLDPTPTEAPLREALRVPRVQEELCVLLQPHPPWEGLCWMIPSDPRRAEPQRSMVLVIQPKSIVFILSGPRASSTAIWGLTGAKPTILETMA